MTVYHHPRSTTDVGINFDTSIEAMIPIGDPVQINCQDKKYNSVFRGVVALECIVADIPIVDGKKIILNYSASITARFLVDGTVYGFKTGLLRVHAKSGLMVMEYPDSIKKYNLRKSRRISVLLPSEVTTGYEKGSLSGQTWQTETLSGAILDLSGIGALIAVKPSKTADVGHKVTISTSLPDGTPIVSLEAKIKNIRKSDEKLLLGVCFEKEYSESKNAVLKFYNECVSYQTSLDFKD